MTVTEQPPVSQGHLLLQMLDIIEGYDMAALDPEGPDVVHIMAEAKKLAFADRLAYMGDVPDAPLAALLSKDHAERQRRRIDLGRAAPHVPPSRLRAGSETTLAVRRGRARQRRQPDPERLSTATAAAWSCRGRGSF